MDIAKILKRKQANVLKDRRLQEDYGFAWIVRGNRVLPENVKSMIITH